MGKSGEEVKKRFSEEEMNRFVDYVVDFAERLVEAMVSQGSIRALEPGGISLTEVPVGSRKILFLGRDAEPIYIAVKHLLTLMGYPEMMERIAYAEVSRDLLFDARYMDKGLAERLKKLLDDITGGDREILLVDIGMMGSAVKILMDFLKGTGKDAAGILLFGRENSLVPHAVLLSEDRRINAMNHIFDTGKLEPLEFEDLSPVASSTDVKKVGDRWMTDSIFKPTFATEEYKELVRRVLREVERRVRESRP